MNTILNHLAIAVALVLGAMEDSQAQNQIRWSVLDAGFAISSSAGNQLKSAVGQSFVGRSNNTSDVVISGFLVETSLALPPPPACSNNQWPATIPLNLPLCEASGAQDDPVVAADGSGGAIVFWIDARGGSANRAIYAQHVDSCGVPLWAQDGIPVIDIGQTLFDPAALPDGQGGAFLVWEDQRNSATGGDIYAQRISGAGTLMWDSAGVPVCTIGRRQSIPSITTDGAGGVIIAWQDNRGAFGTFDDIYAQRLDGNGTPQWQSNGIAISTASGSDRSPVIAGDGMGGAIVAWWDSPFVKAQRVDGAGIVQWTTNGIPVSTITTNVPFIGIASDGNNGAIITWNAVVASSNNIYANRIAADGTHPWGTTEVNVCTASGNQTEPVIIDDGAGGSFVAWQDARHVGQNGKVYAQRISNTGAGVWTQDGIPIDTLQTFFPRPQLVRDGGDGVIIGWIGTRNGLSRVYAQRVNAGGSIQWVPMGQAVAGEGMTNLAMTADVDGGAIFAFQNFAGTSNANLYAKHIFADGSIGTPTGIVPAEGIIPKQYSLHQNYPNPFNPTTTIQFDLPSSASIRITVFNLLGQKVTTLVDEIVPAGQRSVVWDGSNEFGERVSSGVYIYRMVSTDPAYPVESKKMVFMK